MDKIIFVSMLLVFAACESTSTNNTGGGGNTSALSSSETLSYRACEKDDDCVYVNNGCCDCANGGEDLAINKTKLEEFTKLFSCENVACTMIGAVPPCGTGTLKCNAKLCEFTRSTADTSL